MNNDSRSERDHTPPQFFVSENPVQGDRVLLMGQHYKHALAQRLSSGEEFRVVTPESVIHAVVDEVGGGRLAGKIVYVVPKEKPSVKVHLVPCLLKGQKMELVVEKATELGASSITPVVSMRTVPRLNEEKASARRMRWERVARSAAEQCARQDIPVIMDVMPLEAFLGRVPTKEQRRGAFIFGYERREKCLPLDEVILGHKEVTAIVGPEGGFDPLEVGAMIEAGIQPVSIGPYVVRAETASISMVAILVERLTSS